MEEDGYHLRKKGGSWAQDYHVLLKNEKLPVTIDSHYLRDMSERHDSHQEGYFERDIIQGDFLDGFKGWFLQSRENQVQRKHGMLLGRSDLRDILNNGFYREERGQGFLEHSGQFQNLSFHST